MKRLWGILSIVIAVLMFSSASSVSWEGRAVMGDTNDFPGPGKYAKSRMFSKGEMVEVYNPANETKTTVVITGPSDVAGVLIMLSPEAATDLSITQGYDAIVRVNKKLLYAEPPAGSVRGTASAPVAVSETGTPAASEPTAPSDFRKTRSEVFPATPAAAEAAAVKGKETTDPAELVAAPRLPEDSSGSAAVPAAPAPEEMPSTVEVARSAAETSPGVFPEPEPVASTRMTEEPAAEPASIAEEDWAVSLMSAEPAAVPEEEKPEDITGIAALSEENIPLESPSVAELAKTESTATPTSESSDVLLPEPGIETASAPESPELTVTMTALTDAEPLANTEGDTAVAAASEEPVPAELPSTFSASVALSEDPAPAETDTLSEGTPAVAVANTESTADEISGTADFILIPTSMLPPDSSASGTAIASSFGAAEPAKDAGTEIAALTPPAKLPDDLLLYSISDFEKGAFYVQLATMKDIQNIRSVVNTYGKKYPVKIQPVASGAGFRVFVGPLTKDEYGAVLERFKRSGFSDAFAKKM